MLASSAFSGSQRHGNVPSLNQHDRPDLKRSDDEHTWTSYAQQLEKPKLAPPKEQPPAAVPNPMMPQQIPYGGYELDSDLSSDMMMSGMLPPYYPTGNAQGPVSPQQFMNPYMPHWFDVIAEQPHPYALPIDVQALAHGSINIASAGPLAASNQYSGAQISQVSGVAAWAAYASLPPAIPLPLPSTQFGAPTSSQFADNGSGLGQMHSADVRFDQISQLASKEVQRTRTPKSARPNGNSFAICPYRCTPKTTI